MGEESKVYRVLVGKPEGKKQLGRLRRRWMTLQQILRRLDGILLMDSAGSG
jgi:hypothetical protein